MSPAEGGRYGLEVAEPADRACVEKVVNVNPPFVETWNTMFPVGVPYAPVTVAVTVTGVP